LTGPYAAAARGYLAAGWPCVLPLPPGQKTPPPGGFTGGEGADTASELVEQWVTGPHGAGNLALRLPDGVVGIDVDHYDKPRGDGSVVEKRGGDKIKNLEVEFGPLPPTWVSSARETPSGIKLYRVPPGRYRTTVGDAIEVIQRHHRYVVAWPSTNPEHAGGQYDWWWEDAGVRHELRPILTGGWRLPPLDQLPWLPENWVNFLREGAAGESTPLGTWSDGAAMRAALESTNAKRTSCAALAMSADRALRRLRAATEGSRHDALIAAVHDVTHVGARGHPGAAGALAELAELWAELLGGDRTGEFEAAVESSCRKAVTAVRRPTPVPQDPCLLFAGGVLAPVYGGQTAVPEAINGTAPIAWSVRAVVGVGPFDPMGSLDQTLADAVLERLYPGVRYASDAGRWLVRRADRWSQAEGDVTGWSLSLLADLMPSGDPDAEKGTVAHARHLRRARFMTSGPAGALGKKIAARVAVAGEHPAALLITDLDADPDVLWAGGVPWDLRRSGGRPEPAQWIAPDTVHLHSAAVTPLEVPTPRWDAFTAAVWPDPEVRAWALRVLSIGLTGHADRALPLLWGGPGRGKTQVIALLMSLLGTYAHAADPRLLTAADKAHASIVYDLKGRRLSFVDEGPRSGDNPRERLKQLTGGGELTGNPMRGNPVTFRPTHTLVLTSNNEPDVADPALRERIRLLPCEGDPRVVKATRTALGAEAWQQEAPGVLAAMMREAAGWLADRSSAELAQAPLSVLVQVAGLADDQDVIKNWVEECCTPSDQGQRAGELFRNFVDWCRQMGVRNAPNVTRWGRELTDLGYPSNHDRGGKRRPLTLRVPGGWTPPPPPRTQVVTPEPQPLTRSNGSVTGPVTGSPVGDPLVTGLPENPSRGVSAGSPPFSTTPVTSVTSFSPITTTTTTTTTTHKKITSDKTGRTGQPVTKRGLTCENAVTGSRDESDDQSQPVTPAAKPQVNRSLGEEQGVTPAKPSTRTRLTDEEKAERAAARKLVAAERRAETRRAKVTELEGPEVGLPALVRRGQPPELVTVAAAGQLLAEQLRRSDELTLDVENTGYPISHSEYAVRTIQLGDEHAAVVLDAQDAAHRGLAELALRVPGTLRAYNAVADLAALDVLGVLDREDAWRRMHDPVIPAKLDHPMGVDNGDDLKGTARARLGDQAASGVADTARKAVFKAAGWATDTEVDTPIERSGWAQINHRAGTMIAYAAGDVLDAAALARVLPVPAPAVYERERRVQHVVSRVGHVGVRLDRDVVRDLTTRETAAYEAASARLRAHGIDNPNSDQQAGQWLAQRGVPLPLTDGGKPSVAKGPLGLLRPRYPDGTEIAEFIDARLDCQKHKTALSLFLRPWSVVTEHGDGRARPTIYTLGADTGRMSCVRPNLQQVPREGGYRAAVLADLGYLLVSADLASVEVRVMAGLSGDPALTQLVLDGDAWVRANTDPRARNPFDPHNVVAELAFGPGWTKSDRYMVKRGVFGWAYGGGIAALAAQVGCTEEVMGRIVAALAALAPRYVQWGEEVRAAVRAGATEYPTYSGRVIKLDRRYPHKAPNYLIQGTARELLVDALLKWDATEFGGGAVLPVHDEIVAFAPVERAAEATLTLVRCMETELHGIPITAGAGEPSEYWQDAA
jgi:P4 family phage/plasmid primase-like protien